MMYVHVRQRKNPNDDFSCSNSTHLSSEIFWHQLWCETVRFSITCRIKLLFLTHVVTLFYCLVFACLSADIILFLSMSVMLIFFMPYVIFLIRYVTLCCLINTFHLMKLHYFHFLNISVSMPPYKPQTLCFGSVCSSVPLMWAWYPKNIWCQFLQNSILTQKWTH